MSENTRRLCPGWPKGPCGVEAGTPWTNLYCERCDEKRRAHIEAAVEKNILEPTVVDAPVVVQPKEFSEVDWNMYLGRKSDQEDFGDCAIGPPLRVAWTGVIRAAWMKNSLIRELFEEHCLFVCSRLLRVSE